jgi:hypothetical protein
MFSGVAEADARIHVQWCRGTRRPTHKFMSYLVVELYSSRSRFIKILFAACASSQLLLLYMSSTIQICIVILEHNYVINITINYEKSIVHISYLNLVSTCPQFAMVSLRMLDTPSVSF